MEMEQGAFPARCVIGVDFGTLSARAVVCRVSDGEVLSQAERVYAHKVLRALPSGEELPAAYALQHPQDYLDALFGSISEAILAGGIDPKNVVGLALDVTSSVLPLGADGEPLCFEPRFASRPQAYVKLWKHHGAQREAERLTKLFEEKDRALLSLYGGRISSECFFAKLMEMRAEDPEAFAAADRYVEVGDWLCQTLTGEEKRSLSLLCFKSFYREGIGYPPSLMEAEPALKVCVGTKLRGEIVAPGQLFGRLTEAAAQRLGLMPGIPVAAPLFDGHAALPGAGIKDERAALLSLGTSSCLIQAYPTYQDVRGVCSAAYNGILPGYYAYATGQAGFGDALAWYADRMVPAEVASAARDKGVGVHQELIARAEKLKPGESGLLALDWWNGSKPLADTSLSGLMLGMTLQTKPEEVYLALLESLAFGVRLMLEKFNDAGLRPEALHLAGGIAYKNPFFVQLISDVTRMPLLATKPVPTPAIGMAMAAAAVAGEYDTFFDAISAMNCLNGARFVPNETRARAYDPLYAEYVKLSDYFSAENLVMHRLQGV